MGKVVAKPSSNEKKMPTRPPKQPSQKMLPSLEAFLKKSKAISNAIPDEEWAKLPEDGSVNVDHYLYGAPRRTE